MRLPLYTTTRTPIDDSEATQADPLCRRCDLGASVEVACLQPAGAPGGALLVGQAPTRKGHATGRTWSSAVERRLARLVQQFKGHDYPLAFDYAIKCPGGTGAPSIDACRGHLRSTLDAVKPERIIAFGSAASRALTGTTAPTGKVRKCWAKLDDGTPVFFMPEPYHVQANRILLQWMRDDLEWAVTVDPDTLTPPTTAGYTIVDDEDEARRCYAHIAGGVHVFDVETYGKLGEPDFKIVALASALLGEDRSWVWTEESLRAGDPRRGWVEKLLRECKHVAHNAKYEHRSVLCHFGIDMGADATALDTMIAAKLLRADGLVGLDPLANLVGMGGHKDEAREEIAQKVKVLRALRRAAGKEVPVRVETQTRTSPTTGKTQKRKVVTESRPPTQAERREQVVEAWSKPRTIAGEKTCYGAEATRLKDWDAQALLVDVPTISADWVHAALSPHEELSYVYGLIDRDVCYRYNARDTVATSLLATKLGADMRGVCAFSGVYDSHLGRAPWAVGWVESWGIKVDREKLRELEIFFDDESAKLLAEVQTYKPGLNPASTDQLAEFLFKDLKLAPLKKSAKTGKPSTDKVTLEHLRDAHPAIPLIQKWKSITKLNGTYARGLLSFIRHDGRIRAHFNITGTECLPKGELVLTSRGYLPVEKVKVGDTVLAHTGQGRKVTRCVDNGVKPLLEVTTASGLTLTTTGNHEYKTPRGWCRADKLRTGRRVLVHSNPEQWKTVRNWEDFEVSTWGRVRNKKTGRVLAQQPKGKWGHLKVCLHRNGAQRRGVDRKDRTVHGLVALAFIPRPRGKTEVAHCNGIAWDNTVENLRWATSQENRADAVKHCTMLTRKSKQRRLSPAQVQRVRATPRAQISDTDLAGQLGVSRSLVSAIRRGDRHPQRTPADNVAEFRADRVVSVRARGEAQTYGLTVEVDHSHVTGGIVTHNTGRMSCSDPNMQTIPSRGEYAKRVKNVFVAAEGYKLVQLDYKALEVRIAAMLSGDPVLLDVFARGGDPHRETAEAISEILWGDSFADCGGLVDDELAKEQKRRRDVCKTIVFGTLYGQGPAALAQGAGISEDEATRAQVAVLGRYRVLQKWIDKTAGAALRSGETHTWWAGGLGRCRPVPDIGSADSGVAGHGKRQSYNTPVQGTGSEFCVASLVRLVEWIHDDAIDAKLVMTVHDSLVFEVRVDDVPELVEQATRIMTSHESGGVLLDVDVEWGDSWGSLEPYEVSAAA